MKIPTLHQRMFGGINKQLNRIRARMNREIKEKYFSERQKGLKAGDANGP